jgi:hypothetical protein
MIAATVFTPCDLTILVYGPDEDNVFLHAIETTDRHDAHCARCLRSTD